MQRVALMGMALAVASCGGSEVAGGGVTTAGIDQSNLTDGNEQVAIARAPTATLSKAHLASVCKAAIAVSFGRDVSIMKLVSNEGGIVRVRYNRPDDAKRWTNDCRLEGKRIIWRTVDVYGNNGPGVWRTRPEDEVMTFEVEGDKVAITTDYGGTGEGSGSTEIVPLL